MLPPNIIKKSFLVNHVQLQLLTMLPNLLVKQSVITSAIHVLSETLLVSWMEWLRQKSLIVSTMVLRLRLKLVLLVLTNV